MNLAINELKVIRENLINNYEIGGCEEQQTLRANIIADINQVLERLDTE